MNAMLLALEALPKDDKDERPVLPEAEYALAQAVNAYVSTNENQYSVEYAFPHGGKINKILPSQDEKYLTVLHSDYAFTIWDVLSREKIHEQMLESYIVEAAISYDEKLLLLYDLLSTEEAKRIALPRHRFLQVFYKQYKEESNIISG